MNLSSEEDRKVEREGRRDEPLLIAIPCTIPFAAQFCKYFRYLRSIVRYPRQLGSDEEQRQREREREREGASERGAALPRITALPCTLPR